MPANEVAWPTGMSDQDPAARDRPLVFNPQGFLVAILEDAARPSRPRQPWPRPGLPIVTCGSTPAARSWTAGNGSRPNAAWPSASWLTTRSCISVTTATAVKTTSTSAEVRTWHEKGRLS
jgi:hypothetical protein